MLPFKKICHIDLIFQEHILEIYVQNMKFLWSSLWPVARRTFHRQRRWWWQTTMCDDSSIRRTIHDCAGIYTKWANCNEQIVNTSASYVHDDYYEAHLASINYAYNFWVLNVLKHISSVVNITSITGEVTISVIQFKMKLLKKRLTTDLNSPTWLQFTLKSIQFLRSLGVFYFRPRKYFRLKWIRYLYG